MRCLLFTALTIFAFTTSLIGCSSKESTSEFDEQVIFQEVDNLQVENLLRQQVINDKTGLVVVDTVSMLYRLEMGQTDDVYEVNRELGQQISFLGEIARKKGILVLITNQVYSDFENKGNVKLSLAWSIKLTEIYPLPGSKLKTTFLNNHI